MAYWLGELLPEFLGRLLMGGPLLYLGLVMLRDPAGFLQTLLSATDAIATLQQRMQGGVRRIVFRTPRPPNLTRQQKGFVRTGGLLLVLLAMASLAGLAQ